MSDVRVHEVPETSSDQRMHVLDESCWCGPVSVDVTTYDDLPRRVEQVTHRPEDGA